MWFFTVCSVMNSASAISLFEYSLVFHDCRISARVVRDTSGMPVLDTNWRQRVKRGGERITRRALYASGPQADARPCVAPILVKTPPCTWNSSGEKPICAQNWAY